MFNRTLHLISTVFHPAFIFPLTLLLFTDFLNISVLGISFIFFTLLLIWAFPVIITEKIAKKEGKTVDKLNTPKEKAKITMYSLLFFSLAFILLEIFLLSKNDMVINIFRINFYSIFILYIGIYVSSWFLFVFYSLGLNISMHSYSWGAITAFFYFLIYVTGNMEMLTYLFITITISMLVIIARLGYSNHKRWEVYTGFFTGAIIMILACWGITKIMI